MLHLFSQQHKFAATSMKSDKTTLVLPILLITVGAGWLLTTLGVAPGINWVWTLGLAVVGLLTLAVSGFDKVSVVIGPLFIAASVLSVLRQTGRLHADIEVPILVIFAGVLLLVARTPAIPIPKWIIQDPKANGQDGDK
jgi:hypothetical protein